MKNPFRLLLGLVRVLLLAFLVLGGLAAVACLRVLLGRTWFHRAPGITIIRAWCRTVAAIIGIRLHVTGQPAHALRTVNHVSWLDIITLNSVDVAQFVSKHDVKHWPMVGKLAEGSGTFFLRRSSPRAAKRCLDEISMLLRQGHNIAVFPEGTTSDGSSVLHFHGTFFQAAIDSGSMIQPIALAYRRAGQRDKLAPYINDDTFLPHLFRLVCTLRTTAIISYLTPIPTDSRDRKTLARISRSMICQELLLPHELEDECGEPPVNAEPVTIGESR